MRTRLAVTLSLAGIALTVALALLPRRPSGPAGNSLTSTPGPGNSTAPNNARSPHSPAETASTPSTAQASAPAPSLPVRSSVRLPGILGGGLPVRLEDIPPGTPLRETLDRLSPALRDHALSELSRLTFHVLDAQSFCADSTGMIFSVCPGPRPQILSNATTATSSAAAEIPETAAAAVPLSAVPVRHSRPGATRVIYLDFNGHLLSGTQWNAANNVTSYDCLPYDLDGDYTNFSDEEQTRILRIWARVAEDYAPFEVDVTTEEPVTFTRYTARALITRNTDRNGVNMPSSGSGGVAYLNVFGNSNYSTYSPALIYSNNLGSGSGAYISEAASHELGHNFGLSHDGYNAENYYDGHGSGETSWGPIMGSPYGMSVTQWSKGEYTGATNTTEDDFAVLASKISYRADDTGNSTSGARAATVAGTALSATGLIETAGDTDVISFTAGADGTISLTALPLIDTATSHTGNLDIQIELLSASGTVLTLDNPAGSPRASLTASITAGTYYLRITPGSAGAPFATPPTGYTLYGSRGQYTLSGTIPGVVFASFLSTHFNASELLDSLVSGPAADPDGDGLNNLLEYALARNPRQPDAPSSATAGLSGSYLTLTYDRRLDTSDLTYAVQASDDLVNWSAATSLEQVSATALSATVERITVRNAVATAPRRFLRLQISAP